MPTDFLVAGIGGSAGALDAFTTLLKAIAPDAPLTLVIAQHLSPERPSLLVQLLGRVSPFPVQWVEDGLVLAERRVYVAPPGHVALLRHSRFRLAEVETPSGRIDAFFHSLAADRRERAAGVLLSGNGSDGVAGLKAIKASGGVTFAQDDASASFGSMPRAAVEAQCVDEVLPPARIAEALVDFARRTRTATENRSTAIGPHGSPADPEGLGAVFKLLSAGTGVDFSHYKRATIRRRITRRMALTRRDNLQDYLPLLRENRQEMEALFHELLINVTAFFRDPESFAFLRDRVFPEIIARHADGAPIRIWVPGCATGEECYSLAIVAREALEHAGVALPVQIFASDLSEAALARARVGVYSAADVAGLSPERLRRFFVQTLDGFAVTKELRDLCVFARQNVVQDSPFSRLDLVSCRNLLIYFDPVLQRKVMPLFHYALVPEAFLFLGSSESVGRFADLFEVVDRSHRIYQRKPSARRPAYDLAANPAAGPETVPETLPAMASPSIEPTDVIREADHLVINRFGPAGVLVDDQLDIIQYRGDVSRFLAPQPGRASLSLLGMARDGLGPELQLLVAEARTRNERVCRSPVTVLQQGVPTQIEVDVTPLPRTAHHDRCFLILFLERSTGLTLMPDSGPAQPVSAPTEEAYQTSIAQLTRDLHSARATLQSAIEQHEAANHELRAANEEIQSSNEELQSTNEELETAKEELQSTNEELTTVNEELHSRHVELMQVNDDLHNLINSVHLPILILDSERRIRRFTPQAMKVLNVIPGDVGRPLSDINTNVRIPDLPGLFSDVIESLSVREVEVQDQAGRWYSLRMRPYKTADQKIDGVVLTLIEVDQLKRTMRELEEARDLAEAITESNHKPLAVVTDELLVKLANNAFCTLLGDTRGRLVGRPLADVFRQTPGSPDLRDILATVLPQGKIVSGVSILLDLGHGERKAISLDAEPIQGAKNFPFILISCHESPTS